MAASKRPVWRRWRPMTALAVVLALAIAGGALALTAWDGDRRPGAGASAADAKATPAGGEGTSATGREESASGANSARAGDEGSSTGRDGPASQDPTARGLAAPNVTVSVDADGYAVLAWGAVAGANTYDILRLGAQVAGQAGAKGSAGVGGLAGAVVVADRIATLSYTLRDGCGEGDTLAAVAPEPCSAQNTALRAYSPWVGGAVQDKVGNAWVEHAAAWWNPRDLGVVAVAEDGRRSLPGRVDGAALAGQLPVAIATQATDALVMAAAMASDVKGRPFLDSVDALPEEVAITAADGATVLRLAIPLPDRARAVRVRVATPTGEQRIDCARLPLRAVGTRLEASVRVCGQDAAADGLTKDAAKRAAKRAKSVTRRAAAGELGAARLEYASGAPALSQEPPLSRAAPAVDYPVLGSSPLVRFIAANALAGNACLDIEAFGRELESLTLEEAVTEAVTQNPYLLGAGLWVSDSSATALCLGGVPDPSGAVRERREALAGAVEAALAEMAGLDGSEAEAARAINSWLSSRVTYDFETYDPSRGALANLAAAFSRPDAFTAAGALLDGVAVCLGYAEAFQALAAAAGLKSVVVTGTAAGEAHAWNKVRVGGAWRVVDPTWNDAESGFAAPDQYLLLTDAQLAARRSGGPDPDGWVAGAHTKRYTSN